MDTPPLKPIPGKRRGLAPKIRTLKTKFPEMSDAAIARKVGCDPSNVAVVLRRFLGKNSSQDLKDYQANQADVYDSLSMRLLKSLTDKKIAKSRVQEAVTSAAILIDKSRLVRGQATAINVNVLMDVVEAIKSQRGGPQSQSNEWHRGPSRDS